MIAQWFNPRCLISEACLAEIYQFESIGKNSVPYPQAVLEHWMATGRRLDIPDSVRRLYSSLGRPTPLLRATNLERYLGTEMKIFFKREDVLPNGSFKIASALPQAYYGRREGRRRVIVETGAGQTGAAAALASCLFDLECVVLMVRSSYEQKGLRRGLMQFYGADVHPSPSELTQLGRRLLAEGSSSGSIATATSEVFELLEGDSRAMNIAGSLLDFTLAYCSVIGLETREQLAAIGEEPDLILGCVGGGSSFGGFALPFFEASRVPAIVAVESTAVPTLTCGRYEYAYPDSEAQAAPIKMLSLGHDFQPSPMHATGLRYHAASPIVSYLVAEGAIRAAAVDERDAVEAARLLARVEGIVVAPECSYTVRALLDEIARDERGRGVLVALITGSGHLDLEAYAQVDRQEVSR